ncbi:phage tail assembly protein [Roseomonas sp. F4]
MSKTIPLSKPIQDQGEQVTALTLRLPTGKDLRTCGVPYKLTQDSEIIIEAAAMHRMIGKLSGLLSSSIDQLTAGDWNAAAQEVLGFITAEEATTTPAAAPKPAMPLGHHEGH